MPVNRKESVEELLDPEKRLGAKIRNLLRITEKPQIILLLINSEHYSAVQQALLNFLGGEERCGVFVSVNKPLANLSEMIDIPKKTSLVFVDLVSESANIPKVESKNARYLEGPQNLLEVAVLTEKELNVFSTVQKFVVVDSLSTLLLYNKPEILERFIHTFCGKLRSLKASGILLMTPTSKDKGLIRSISQFCDEVIEVEENEAKTK